MVTYNEISLTPGKYYKVSKQEGYSGCSKCFGRAVQSINSMSADRHPITVISPLENLTKETKEEFKKFFCKRAQEEGINFVYFEGPVSVTESDPLEGTMFD